MNVKHEVQLHELYGFKNKKEIQSACDQAKRMKFINSNNY